MSLVWLGRAVGACRCIEHALEQAAGPVVMHQLLDLQGGLVGSCCEWQCCVWMQMAGLVKVPFFVLLG